MLLHLSGTTIISWINQHSANKKQACWYIPCNRGVLYTIEKNISLGHPSSWHCIQLGSGKCHNISYQDVLVEISMKGLST